MLKLGENILAILISYKYKKYVILIISTVVYVIIIHYIDMVYFRYFFT